MSRGLGKVQRFVLAELHRQPVGWHPSLYWRDKGAEKWHDGWLDVSSLAGRWSHSRICDEPDHHRCDTDQPTRTEIESVRRGVKALERTGLVETRHRNVVVGVRFRPGRERRVYADDRVFSDGRRIALQARRPLSVEERQQSTAAQRLRDDEVARAFGEALAAVRGAS